MGLLPIALLPPPQNNGAALLDPESKIWLDAMNCGNTILERQCCMGLSYTSLKLSCKPKGDQLKSTGLIMKKPFLLLQDIRAIRILIAIARLDVPRHDVVCSTELTSDFNRIRCEEHWTALLKYSYVSLALLRILFLGIWIWLYRTMAQSVLCYTGCWISEDAAT
ncbi:hypothetical protein Tco_0392661 [Tanacetum coccineum]